VERKVEKHSRNSSWPPSSGGLKRQTAAPCQPGNRSSGGQPSHPGATRAWTEHPNEMREVRPEGNCGCGCPLWGQVEWCGESRQQIEIPEPKARVIEYRQIIVVCACGVEHRGRFPGGVTTPPVSYGPRLKAYAVGLVDGHFVVLVRTAEILADQYGIKPSVGAIQGWIGQAAARLRETYVAQRQVLLATHVVHFDESGVRVKGCPQWLHVTGSAEHVFYTVHPKRGQEAMTAADLLPTFTGVAVHDHWRPYFGFEQATHSLCNAHILRELRYFAETTGGHQWPIKLQELLVEGKEVVAVARAEGRTTLNPVQVDHVLARYDHWGRIGLWVFPERNQEPRSRGRPKQHPATNLPR
jgi:transposase